MLKSGAPSPVVEPDSREMLGCSDEQFPRAGSGGGFGRGPGGGGFGFIGGATVPPEQAVTT
jgi:hypothetical protein